MKMILDKMKGRGIPTEESQRTKFSLMQQSYQLTPCLNIENH